MRYKRIHAQPLIVSEDRMYKVEVHFNPGYKIPKHWLTVTELNDNLIYCEKYSLLVDVFERIKDLQYILQLEEYCEE